MRVGGEGCGRVIVVVDVSKYFVMSFWCSLNSSGLSLMPEVLESCDLKAEECKCRNWHVQPWVVPA